MAGTGWTKAGKPPHPNSWVCSTCSTAGDPMLVWPKKDVCPGRRGCPCGKKRPKNVTLFSATKEGKAVAAAKQGNGGNKGGGKGQGGSNGGGKGGGKSTDPKTDAYIKRIEAENRKLKADKVDDTVILDDEGDEEMDDDLKSEEDWKRVIEKAKADDDYATACLKKWPKEPKYVQMAEDAKAQIEAAKQRMGQLRSPSEQLQHKLNREKKLNAKIIKLEADIKSQALEIAVAEDELEAKRNQYHEAQAELQLIESQKLLLVAVPTAPPQPVDVAQCVESMREGLQAMFEDQRLSGADRAKRAEVEAGFVAMRSIFDTLANIRLNYAACTTAASAAPTGNGTPPDPATTNPAAGGEGTGAAESPGGATMQATDEVSRAAAPVAAATAPVLAPRPVPDGPADERAANRDRTPPPGGGRAKAVAAMPFAQLVGAPTRPRDAAAAKNKAATKTAA